ncbi:MAG TPA: deoxyribose-phosphate aldolase [Acholeplasmataceae bacterium]|jgi:deoxyribose-phosphate aldolase|nr:deoxyribose-phosphate aldolase [Acholeplasmataceae bacterium]
MNNKLIDHTLLKANATLTDIKKLCEEAREHHFKSVCVNPGFVKRAKEFLAGSDVLVCTVIGFPLGANTIETKVFETEQAVNEGADEIDMVINISKAKEHDFSYLEKEIRAVVEAANKRTVKVIIETCYLTDEEKVAACKAAAEAGADFVKTSTGFGTGGATVEDVALMRKSVPVKMGVKASGGIRTKEALEAMVAAGANRIGASAGIKLIEGGSHGDAAY